MTTSQETIRNPLEGLASVLALRDLRQRIQPSVETRGQDGWERCLLELDPLTVLRCMRVAHSPVYDLSNDLLTIPQLCTVLGNAMVRRALNTPASDIAGTEPVRRLWLHAVATAHAARSLAQTTGICDPEQAYVLGLLHDLPLWLHYLSLRRNGTPAAIGPATWIEHWHLPQRLGEVVEQSMLGQGYVHRLSGGDSASVVAAAEFLAELADFWHPDDGEQLSRSMLLSVVTKEDLVEAHNLRQRVTRSLGEFGLQAVEIEPEQLEPASTEALSLFGLRNQSSVTDLVLSLLSCNDSAHYRGVITATTAAALRYLGFERTYCVQWSRDSGRCYIRAKADLSPRPLRPTTVDPSPHERDLMRRSQATGEVLHLVNEGARGGLLRLLGADEVLLVPLNREFALPAFLVMDRALSGIPIRLSQDRIGARALAGTVSLLAENLLLKKRRTRAQTFSLTDPLTRLFNRSVGISRLSQEIARSKRSSSPLTVLMLDLDNFKHLNDSRGHLIGDQALRATADVLRKTLRKTDILCRYGGEEFLVILPETSVEDASISATRVFIAVEEAGRSMQLPLTISIGLSAVRTDEDDVTSVLTRADRALYASKTHGRNRFSVDGE